jgi:excisionase family DNA binding protein
MGAVAASVAIGRQGTIATLLTTSAAARLLGVHRSTVARWVDAGLLPAVRLPSAGRRRGSIRIEASEIDRLRGQPRPNGEHVDAGECPA